MTARQTTVLLQRDAADVAREIGVEKSHSIPDLRNVLSFSWQRGITRREATACREVERTRGRRARPETGRRANPRRPDRSVPFGWKRSSRRYGARPQAVRRQAV